MNTRLPRLAVAFLASAYFLYCAKTPEDFHFIDNANLIFHEAGHVIFMFFGEFIHILMGSGFQILLPLCITGYFFFTQQRLSAAVTLMWTGENFVNVSVYAGDAIARQLPLLGGDGVIHDWHYIMVTLGILSWTPQVAAALYFIGCALIILGAVCAVTFAYADAEQKASTTSLVRRP